MDRIETVGHLAAEIDRLVIGGHDLADAYPNKPDVVAEMKAFPHLLNTVATVLLEDHRLTRTEFTRIMPFAPPSLVGALIDNNVTEGIVSVAGDVIALTDIGRATAEGVVQVQEASVADAWATSTDRVASGVQLVAPLVQRARDGGPLSSPSNFVHFADVCARPTPPATLLRSITAMRYWRADAHLLALERADLRPSEAHALNRLWDVHRDITRVGQGFGEPGRKGVASLEGRGLASGGVITADGIALRENIERETNLGAASIYDPLDDAETDRLLQTLRAIPNTA